MKAWLFTAAASLGIMLSSCERSADSSDLSDQTDRSDPSTAPSTTTTDATEVFQRAFWKRPAETDRIIHAVRREWLDDDAVSRWDWFLEVEPSPEIIRHLRDDNAFSLSRADSADIPANAPEWFIRKTAGSQIYAAPGGGMTLIFMPDDTKLFATGSGGGFHRGVPESSVPQTDPNPPGRLPTSPPPSTIKP